MESLQLPIMPSLGDPENIDEEGLYPRYCFFVVSDEAEALHALRDAFTELYGVDMQPVRFDEDGNLVYKQQATRDRRGAMARVFGGLPDIETVYEEDFDESIALTRYKREHLLEIQVYDDSMEPDRDNLMIARHLMKVAKSYTQA